MLNPYILERHSFLEQRDTEESSLASPDDIDGFSFRDIPAVGGFLPMAVIMRVLGKPANNKIPAVEDILRGKVYRRDLAVKSDGLPDSDGQAEGKKTDRSDHIALSLGLFTTYPIGIIPETLLPVGVHSQLNGKEAMGRLQSGGGLPICFGGLTGIFLLGLWAICRLEGDLGLM